MVACVLAPENVMNVNNWIVSVVNVSGNAVLVVEGVRLNREGRLFIEEGFAWSVEILDNEGSVYPLRRINLNRTQLSNYLQNKRESWDANPKAVENMIASIDADIKKAMVPEEKGGRRIAYQALGADHPLAGLFGPGHNSASWCNEKLRIAIPGIGTPITGSKPKKIGTGCVIL